jgi:hypothetical protein
MSSGMQHKAARAHPAHENGRQQISQAISSNSPVDILQEEDVVFLKII